MTLQGKLRAALQVRSAAAAALLGIASAGFSFAVAQRPAPPPPEARVDINHASLDALLKVPGMTKSWAGRILRFRPYRSKQDLLEQGVVSSEVYDRIKDYVIAHKEKQ